jgi:hypothetical protein
MKNDDGKNDDGKNFDYIYMNNDSYNIKKT